MLTRPVARRMRGLDAPLNLPKGPLLATKMGQKWGVCKRVKGVKFKSPLFGCKRSTFWGSRTPSKKIDLGYGPDVNKQLKCNTLTLDRSFLLAASACHRISRIGRQALRSFVDSSLYLGSILLISHDTSSSVLVVLLVRFKKYTFENSTLDLQGE